MKKLLGILVLSLLWCNVGFADAASVKKACRDLGFEPGTELFLDCALKLMSKEKQSDQSITLKPEECSQYKKLHKKIRCKMGGYDDDDGGESFNEKYKTLADIVKKKEDSPKDKNKEDSSNKETFNEKYKTLADVFKKVKEEK